MPSTQAPPQVTVVAQVPPSWRRYDKVVEQLVYPMELACFTNFELQPTGELGDLVPARPRIDTVPSRGAMLWLTLGDRDSDQTETEPFVKVKRQDVLFDATPPLDASGEQVESIFSGVREYRRTIGLGSTLYVNLLAWVGAKETAPTSELQSLITSLQFTY